MERVGRGAMSVVWQARDERLDRVVAVKQFLPEPLAGPVTVAAACERAIREARLASRLRHPHAITVYDVFEDAGSMYLTMEYLPSRSLTELLADRRTMPPGEVIRLGHQIGSALAAAHADRILHRDVTPNNVLVTDEGVAKITDFGISHALGENPAAGDGIVVGTIPYLAPEIAGGGDGGLPSDVYSLGATLYTALEGAPPFGSSDNPITLLRRIIEEEPAPPVHRGPLADLLLRMLERDPAARPSMAEVVDLLAAPRRSFRLSRVAMTGVAACSTAAAVVAGLTLTARPETTAAPIELPRTTVTTDHTVHATTTAPPPPGPPSRRPASPAPVHRAGCTARYEVTSSWPGGAQATVTVHNDQPTRLTGWVVTWNLPGGTDVRDLWNGTITRQGSRVTVTDAGWNALIEATATTSFGLNQLITTGGPEVPVLSCRPD